MDNGVCKEPTAFYLLAVALRSFFLVLATHLLAGEVDTSLAGVPLARRISWWCRYYNPLNLSWRYYSMFAYRFTAHSWGNPQLALINHEEHPLLPPLPYIVGETVHPLCVRRLEMAGLLSSQGILTFSAAYQGALAIQYAISTEGIPYLPNTTVPLAMVGLFRVMGCKWVASKIHVDAYPYPCMPSPLAPSSISELNVCTLISRFLRLGKSSIRSLWGSSPNVTTTTIDSSSPQSVDKFERNSLPTFNLVKQSQTKYSTTFLTIPITPKDPLPTAAPIVKCSTAKSPSRAVNTTSNGSSAATLHLPPLLLPSSIYTIDPPSLQSQSPSVLKSPNRPLLPTLYRPYSMLSLSPHAMEPANVSKCNTELFLLSRDTSSLLSKASLSCSPSEENHGNTSIYSKSKTFSPIPCSQHESSSLDAPRSPTLSAEKQSRGFHIHANASAEQPLPYKSNKIVVRVWIGVLVGLVIMSFLPYKVAAAYQLPHRLLQFSMQIFYQYIAVSEFIFHAYLLYQGPIALANRVLFFDHWSFKAQTCGFYCLLMFMLVVSLIDFVKHEFYRACA
ncbi:hypothetical protein GOP47_0016162 [Adiantum capillus-veneris]|uniref:Uncharacterized protein n=1 Tax=Adiantum capillus-veneris TaxID=13818 RepID=A0A9D4UL53_ADICA|nr:hypothetical protein GOP47_0016162 [Adiantum capillus-veneris]